MLLLAAGLDCLLSHLLGGATATRTRRSLIEILDLAQRFPPMRASCVLPWTGPRAVEVWLT